MKGYGQFCPVAKAAEIVAERWTPLVLRELLCGSRRFSDLHWGVPLMSRTLLAGRLEQLEDAGIVQSVPRPRGRGREYHLTAAGEELRPLIDRFYRGASGSAEERIKLFKLIRDAMGSEFGARHEWYERNYGGSAELVRLDALRFGQRGGTLAACKDLVVRPHTRPLPRLPRR